MSDDPTAFENVTLVIKKERKILSTAQDIFYLRERGGSKCPNTCCTYHDCETYDWIFTTDRDAEWAWS